MQKICCLFAISIGLGTLLGFNYSAAAEVLRVGGTGAATEMLKVLGEAYAAHSEHRLEVIPSLGSSGGIRALADGAIALSVSGRPLKPEESAKGLTVVATIQTPFVFVSSHRQLPGLNSAELPALYTNEKAAWTDGTPLRIILRPREDSDTTTLDELFPGMSVVLERARQRADVPVAGTDQDNADMAERLPGSLTAVTLTQIDLEKRNLRVLPIDGVAPSLESLETGAYRYAKTLRFIASTPTTAAVRDFIGFLKSPKGREILRASDSLPVE